jgi:hypothetical protein
MEVRGFPSCRKVRVKDRWDKEEGFSEDRVASGLRTTSSKIRRSLL